MSTHLVTGKAGYEHVKASDHGALHAAIMGGGEFVLEGGEQFACQVISNNKVRIFDGEALMQGRHIRIDRNTYEETTHDNGVQGYKRIDLVVLTYTKDEGTGVENVVLEVIKGTPSENNPTVPEYVTGDILNNGELKNQMPLYKIPFDGLSIGEPEAMFSTVPTLETMKKEVDAEVDAKKTELDKKFATLEGSIDEKIAEAGKPLASDADDWALIEKYGEYSADAKTVGEELASTNGRIDTLNTNVNGKAPKNHASGATTYGVGNASNFGHVKLSDTYTSKVDSGAAANGMGASQNALYNAYNAMNTKVSKVKTYVGSDGKLHFVDASGKDTTLNFSSGLVSVTDSFSLTNPLLNNIGMNSDLGYVIYSLYPIDFTDIKSITHRVQHLNIASSSLCVSITDEQLTSASDIIANASFTIGCSGSGSGWVYTTEADFDTSNITGKKYIGIALQNVTSSNFVNISVFTLNKNVS